MEPHFHKDWKISEKDLIPDDSVYSAFPKSALEGQRIAVEDTGGTFNFYQYFKGAWRAVGAQGGSLILLGEETLLSAASSISLTGLPAKEYLKIVLDVPASLSAADKIWLRFNGDTGAANYASRVETNSGNNGYTSDAKIYLDDNSTSFHRSFFIEAHNRETYQKRVSFQGSLTNGAAGIFLLNGAGVWNNVTDLIDEINILTESGNNFPAHTKLTVYGI